MPDAPDGAGVSVGRDAQLAFDGMNYLVVWGRQSGGGEEIYGTRVTTAGGVLDPAGVRISQVNDSLSRAWLMPRARMGRELMTTTCVEPLCLPLCHANGP